ncbi:MAG: tetratricopeptide repeat protein [Candidatus Marinimicrobia bacterium]|nr:tetratricopeptide repeat protein [Candidatus Neomarinimicrobiota bacterium]
MITVKVVGVVLIALLFSTSIEAGFLQTTQKKTKKKEDNSSSPNYVDVSDIWLNTVWKSIDEITTTKKSFEVEKVTTVAGVRGAEAEAEATKNLYYRGSMRVPSRAELKEAINMLENTIANEPANDKLMEMKHYIIQCYLQLNDEEKAAELREELIREYPDSKWAEMYRKESTK